MQEEHRRGDLLFLTFLFLAISLLFSYFAAGKNPKNLRYRKGMDKFISDGIICNEEVDRYIEKDYFSAALENGDFSRGLSHWGTAGSGNKFELDDKEYVSRPYSLHVEVEKFPGRLYYVKSKNFVHFKLLPWPYQSKDAWLGVKPGTAGRVSFFYKGSPPTLYINLLKKSGNAEVLVSSSEGKESLKWEKVELRFCVPEDGRAIMLEITLNAEGRGKSFWIDDVQIAMKKDSLK